MLTKIYDLAYEVDGDDVNLEQDMGCGDVHRITLHQIHVRLLCERMGFLLPDTEAERTIARLGRQLRILLDRIDVLDDWLNLAAQRGHEDLAQESTYSFATWELANEFVHDLPTLPAVAGPVAGVAGCVSGAVAVPDRTNAARQKRHRERQKQQRNAVTGVTDSPRNATPGACPP